MGDYQGCARRKKGLQRPIRCTLFYLKILFPGGPSLKSECVRQIAFRATPILIDEDPKREAREIIAPPHYIRPRSTPDAMSFVIPFRGCSRRRSAFLAVITSKDLVIVQKAAPSLVE
jgi:hypothetical protein